MWKTLPISFLNNPLLWLAFTVSTLVISRLYFGARKNKKKRRRKNTFSHLLNSHRAVFMPPGPGTFYPRCITHTSFPGPNKTRLLAESRIRQSHGVGGGTFWGERHVTKARHLDKRCFMGTGEGQSGLHRGGKHGPAASFMSQVRCLGERLHRRGSSDPEGLIAISDTSCRQVFLPAWPYLALPTASAAVFLLARGGGGGGASLDPGQLRVHRATSSKGSATPCRGRFVGGLWTFSSDCSRESVAGSSETRVPFVLGYVPERSVRQ